MKTSDLPQLILYLGNEISNGYLAARAKPFENSLLGQYGLS